VVEGDLEGLRRDPAIEDKYSEHKLRVTAEWATPYDRILAEKFGFGREQLYVGEEEEEEAVRAMTIGNGDDDALRNEEKKTPKKKGKKKKWVSVPRLHELEVGEARTALVPNEFPYHVDTSLIQHYVLWKVGGSGSVEEGEVRQAERTLRARFHLPPPGGCDEPIITINNPAHRRSLPGIDHVHFLVRLPQPPEP
jgi:hypothetical protein